jgi:hypothetical protein
LLPFLILIQDVVLFSKRFDTTPRICCDTSYDYNISFFYYKI